MISIAKDTKKETDLMEKVTQNCFFYAKKCFTSIACVFFQKNLFFNLITVLNPTLYSFATVLMGTLIVNALITK